MAPELFADLKDIAAQTGYSVSTVSRALKNKGELSAATRSRILSVAEQLGYHDNRLSNGMRTGKTGMVGIIISPADPFFNQLVISMHDYLQERDYLPVISWKATQEQQVIRRMIEQRVEGIIIVPSQDHADNSYFMDVISRGIPIVSVDRKTPADIDFIGTDDYAGGWMTAEHLYALGHRHLGYYYGPQAASPALLRRQGFEDFCKEHTDCHFYLIGTGKWDQNSDDEIADYLQKMPQLTGAGAFYDSYALQLLRVAEKLGRRVPEDLAVIGFGNVGVQWLTRSDLTSFDQKPREIADATINALFHRINNPDSARLELRIKPELVIRSSTAKQQ